MDDLKIFIGGQWRHGDGNPMQSYFPADGSINATLNAASPDDLHDAIEAGRARVARSRPAPQPAAYTGEDPAQGGRSH